MVVQYSNQETSVTIGESVRDEDGISLSPGSTVLRKAYYELVRDSLGELGCG
jgi:phosphoribosylpyrophosphate synthetase